MRGWLNKNQRQKQIISRLKNENAKLRQVIKKQDEKINYLDNKLEQALLLIDEWQRIIFGKKQKKDKDEDNQGNNKDNNKSEPKKRDPSSYRRPIPKENEVTDYQECHIDNCPDCGGRLTNIKVVVRYIEDMLPLSEWFKALKTVTKKFITTGYCCRCKKRVSAEKLGKQTASIGENVKQFTVFANIIFRLSYSQIADFLNGIMRFNISGGEIANILENQADKLRPEFERLLHNIRGQPGAHFDETSWKVQKNNKTGGNYCWVMTGTETPDTVFLLGKNRGKGNAEELRGNNNDQVGISDDYGAYQNIFAKHQLCWAHPHRKLRDLKNSDNLAGIKKENCQNAYKSFAALYEEIRMITSEPFIREKREKARKRLMRKFEQVIIPNDNDPVKLQKIKERLTKQKKRYFTCIIEPGIPADNNKAERALRHLVIKRKNCFGSKTSKGAEIGSILHSVLLSYWWKSKQNFFREFEKLTC